MSTNLPNKIIQDSAADTKVYFNNYGVMPLEFASSDVDASIGFLTNKGFDQDAAIVVAEALLKQAKLDNIPVFQLLDSLSGFDSIDLSILVGQILNNNRVVTSTLGFRVDQETTNKSRNISA